MKNLLLLTLSLLLSGVVFAQQSTGNPFIETIHYLHNKLISPEKEEIRELKELMEKWDAMHVPRSEKRSFLFATLNGYVLKGRSAKFMRKYFQKNLIRLYPAFEDEDLETVKKNATLIDLFKEDLLVFQYPFSVNEESLLYAELQEYELKNELKIGEIGAGSGLVSMLIASTYSKLEIYLNELSGDMVAYMKSKHEQFPGIRGSNKIYVVQGEKDRTNLENRQLDLIFIRDAFHHFSEKEKMIQSIHQSLNAQGVVIVVEEVLDHEVDLKKCKMALRKADVIGLFEKGGFTCVKARGNGGQYLFKFQKK